MNRVVGVYGASGAGRGILPVAREQLRGTDVELVFIDDGMAGQMMNGHITLSWDQFLALDADQKQVSLAVANSRVREMLADKCASASIPLLEVRADSVVQMDDVTIGEGAVLSPFVALTSNIRIGRCFHANLYCQVEHDCVIGDFVTFAPGARCNGNITIEDHAYIGSNAVIKQGTPDMPLVIGKGAVIGMGAVVTKDVLPGATVVGNPARPMASD